MPDLYKTGDGQVFDLRSVAESHQAYLNAGIKYGTPTQSQLYAMNAQKKFRTGEILYKEEKYDQAIIVFTDAIDMLKNTALTFDLYKAYNYRGISYANIGKLEQAIADLEISAANGNTDAKENLSKLKQSLITEGCINFKELPKGFTGKAKVKYEYSVYEGDFVNGKPHGIGIEHHKSGQTWEGEFVDGELTGKGKHLFSTGSVYEGDFIKGEWTGYGIYTEENGKVKEGYWENGIYKGKGILKKLFGKK